MLIALWHKYVQSVSKASGTPHLILELLPRRQRFFFRLEASGDVFLPRKIHQWPWCLYTIHKANVREYPRKIWLLWCSTYNSRGTSWEKKGKPWEMWKNLNWILKQITLFRGTKVFHRKSGGVPVRFPGSSYPWIWQPLKPWMFVRVS